VEHAAPAAPAPVKKCALRFALIQKIMIMHLVCFFAGGGNNTNRGWPSRAVARSGPLPLRTRRTDFWYDGSLMPPLGCGMCCCPLYPCHPPKCNIMENDIAKLSHHHSMCHKNRDWQPIDALQHLSGYLSCIALGFVDSLGGAGLSTLEDLRCLELLAALKSSLVS